jgi:hypothetical protein
MANIAHELMHKSDGAFFAVCDYYLFKERRHNEIYINAAMIDHQYQE